MPTRTNSAKWSEKAQRWQINVQKDGKRRSFYSSTPGRNGQREANRKADAWLEASLVRQGSRIDTLLDAWLAEVKETTSYSHWRQYDGYARNWIKPQIGGMKIENLTEQHLQAIITAGFKKDLAHKTLCNMRACLTAFVKYCRKCRVTTLRPENVTIPKGAKKSEKTILQPEDVRTLFSSDMTTWRGRPARDWFIHAYRFAVTTGLRPGELIGLEWKNIRGDKITITGSINNDGERTQGKNDNARRTFKVPLAAQRELELQRGLLKTAGLLSPYVFPRQDGDFVRQTAFERAWDRYCAHNGLPKTSPYELRHTFVSINKDMPDALLKAMVGHSEDMDTQATYGHELQGDMQRAAGMVDVAFSTILRSEFYL